MLGFTYYAPTKVEFGPDSERKVGELLKEQGAKKVLIHYGSERVKRSGLLQTIEGSLDAAGISYVELGGVVPNPHLSKVLEGIALCRKEGVDFLLAVGGGSVVDSCKAIGYGLADEEQGDVWDFYTYKRMPKACCPLGVVLTIAATGSEMSNSSVITKDDANDPHLIGGWKRSCNTEYSRPKFAVMDPDLTKTLPEYQTMSGITDILMHTLERYLNHGGNMELTASISEALMRTVMQNAKILLHDPLNYDARAEIMWASSLSHNGLTGCGTDGGDWVCHYLEHELGGMYDCAHGAGLAAIWGTWARYVYQNDPQVFARLAVEVCGVALPEGHAHTALTELDTPTLEHLALASIEAMEAFFRSINMPTNLRELGVAPSDEDYKILAKSCMEASNGGAGSVKFLTEQDMETIYRQAY